MLIDKDESKVAAGDKQNDEQQVHDVVIGSKVTTRPNPKDVLELPQKRKSKYKKCTVIGNEKKLVLSFDKLTFKERQKKILLTLHLREPLVDVVLDGEHDLKIYGLLDVTVNNVEDQFFFFDVTILKKLCVTDAYDFLENLSKQKKRHLINCRKCKTTIPSVSTSQNPIINHCCRCYLPFHKTCLCELSDNCYLCNCCLSFAKENQT